MGYSQEIYSDATDKLERRRLANEQDLERRRDLLYQRSPRAQQVVQKLAHTSVLAARAVIRGADAKTELEKLRKENQALQAELQKIIASFGLPENYLDEWYFCNKCHDTGYVDGRICSCMKTLLRNSAYEQLNRISPLEPSDFDAFSLEYYSKTPIAPNKPSPYEVMSKILTKCRQYSDSFSDHSSSLLFQGGPGLGKTHLSLSIAKNAIDKGFGVVYVSAPAILSKLEKEYFSRYNYANTQQLLEDCDLLIIDDLGTEFTSRYTISALYNIINSRSILTKPTIISTNLTIAELQDTYNSRIISRIIGMFTRVEFIGTDVRQQKRRAKMQQPKD